MKKWKCFYTRVQLAQLYSAWGVSAEVPTRAKRTIVAFPIGAQYTLAEVETTTHKSDQGKALFLVTLSNP